jgi:predicted O-methyltransferase YrrM
MTKPTSVIISLYVLFTFFMMACHNNLEISSPKTGKSIKENYAPPREKSEASVESILDKYIQAAGGKKAIEKLTTRQCKGIWVSSYQPAQKQQEGTPFESFGKLPNKWTVTYFTPDGRVRYGSDQKKGWRQNPDRIEQDQSMIWARLGFIMNPQAPLYISRNLSDLKLLDQVSLTNQPLNIIGPEDADNAYGGLYFDDNSGMLIQLGINWELQDYREVDGIQFPFRIIVHYRDGSSGAFIFDEVEHNLPAADIMFEMPTHEELFAAAFVGIDDPTVLPMLTTEDLTYVHEDMNVPCLDGRFLYDLILEKNYKRGLEIGTFTGYSTLWMGLALKKTEGSIITIEIDPVPGEVAKQNFEKAGLLDIIDVRINDALEEIPKIEGEFDFVFIDAWKPDYIKYLKLIRDRIHPGGAIIAHNVTNYARDMKDYIEAIQNDPGLETTFHELSAEGFSLSIIRK